MKCIILLETNASNAQNLKDCRNVFIKTCEIFKLRYITLADKVKNSCRIYFNICDDAYLKPQLFLHLAELYLPGAYMILRDFENDLCFIRSNGTMFKTAFTQESISSYLSKIYSKDSLLKPSQSFFSKIIK